MNDIIDMLEEEGYDLRKISEEKLEKTQERFEDEMDEIIEDCIEEHRKELIFEYSKILKVNRKNKTQNKVIKS